jgi:hypothetical protein
MLAAISGLPPEPNSAGAGARGAAAKPFAMPAAASAAFASTGARTLLTPAMSTTLYIMVMSLAPT